MIFKRLFPILDWLPRYKYKYLSGDLYAGLTVGIMLIPQGMAYAMIAGLPPVYGLYASMAPLLAYAIMGTSRQMSVGPVALESLLVAAGLGSLSILNPDQYISMAIILALMTGSIQLLLGLFRMGFIVSLMSKPVLNGFTFAAACIIGASQLQHLFGIQVPSSGRIDRILIELLYRLDETNIMALSIGIGAMALLHIFKKRGTKIPVGLFVVILGILVVSITKWDLRGLPIVGEIPTGLPEVKFPNPTKANILDLIPIATVLAVVSFMHSMAVAKTFDRKKKGVKIRPNQELIALGSANIFGSFFQSFSSSGGFSRTAVNNQAGANTGMASIVSALFVGFVLLFFTSVFYKLPKAILGAIIMMAVIRLISLDYPSRLFKVRKDEFGLYLITLLSTLFLGIMQGLGIGILCSLILLVYRTSNPHFAFLGRIKNTPYYRNVNRFPNEVIKRGDLLIFRFDAQLFFGNVDYFNEIIFNKINSAGKNIKGFILSAESIPYIDSTAVEHLVDICREFKKKQIRFMISGAIGPTRDVIFNSNIIKYLGNNNMFINTEEAVKEFDKKRAPSNIEKKIVTQNNSNI